MAVKCRQRLSGLAAAEPRFAGLEVGQAVLVLAGDWAGDLDLGADGWTSGVTSGDELLVKLSLVVGWFILSSIWGGRGTPPPLNGKECGTARKEKG